MKRASPGPIRVATRGSQLALAQAETVLGLCRAAFPGVPFELLVLKTTGDRLQKHALAENAKLPKGLFTKELEAALLEGRADLAVHSLKDLPTGKPAGLRVAAVLPRADPSDVLITRLQERRPAARARGRGHPDILPRLPLQAVVATGSTRRSAQLQAVRPDLRWAAIRGNVPTRLQKVVTQTDIHATILAAAGLARLGIHADADGVLHAPDDWAPQAWDGRCVAEFLPLDLVLPAPGQAAIAIECRTRDAFAGRVCRQLNHAATMACVSAERAFLSGFGGGCQSPVAALATSTTGGIRLQAVVFEGDQAWRVNRVVPASKMLAIARRQGALARRALQG